MKPHLVAVLAALTGALSFNTFAADDAAKKESTPKTGQAKSAKPHSHLDEKGIPHSEPDKAKHKSQKKNVRHEHQRDAK